MLFTTATFGPVARDRAVALVHLADEHLALADQGAGEGAVGGDEVLHRRAVHHRGVAPRRRAGSSRSCPWWSTCRWCPPRPTGTAAALNSCDRSSARASRPAPTRARGLDVGHRLLDGGGRHQDLARAGHAASRPGDAADAAAAQEVELRGVRPWSSERSEPSTVRRGPGRSAPGAACRCRRCRRRNKLCRDSSPEPINSAGGSQAASRQRAVLARDRCRIGVVAPAAGRCRPMCRSRCRRSPRALYPQRTPEI